MAKKTPPEASVKKVEPGFQVVEVAPGPIVFRGREIDLSKLTIKEAKRLAGQGLRYIKLTDS